MNFKGLSVVAAMLFLAACASDQNTGANTGGSSMGNSSSSIIAGSKADFDQNVGDRVFFDYDRSSVKAEGQATLQRQAAWLQKYPSVKVVIEGNCDERGTREYNLALGERRAQAVKKALVALGVASNRITTISYGKERPAVVGSNEQAWAQNRRGVTAVQVQ